MKPSLFVIILVFVFNQSTSAQLSGIWRSSKGNNIELIKTDYGFSFFDVNGETPIEVTKISESSCERRYYDADRNWMLHNYYVSDFLITVTNGMNGKFISEWTRIGDKEGTMTVEPSYSINSGIESPNNSDNNNNNNNMIRMFESKIRTIEGWIQTSRIACEKHRKNVEDDFTGTSQNTEQSYALLLDSYRRQISSLQQQIDRLR